MMSKILTVVTSLTKLFDYLKQNPSRVLTVTIIIILTFSVHHMTEKYRLQDEIREAKYKLNHERVKDSVSRVVNDIRKTELDRREEGIAIRESNNDQREIFLKEKELEFSEKREAEKEQIKVMQEISEMNDVIIDSPFGVVNDTNYRALQNKVDMLEALSKRIGNYESYKEFIEKRRPKESPNIFVKN